MGFGKKNETKHHKNGNNMVMVNPSFEPDDNTPRFPKCGIKMQHSRTHIMQEENMESNYEPYENRKVKKPTTDMETLVHLLKISLGSGILAMPSAFSHSGYITGIIGTVIIAVICTYCVHMLVSTGYELSRRRRVPSLTYQGIAVAGLEEGPAFCRAIAPYSGIIVNIYLVACHGGVGCIYTVFIAENLKKVIDLYVTSPVDLKIYMLALLLPLILINWVRKLKYLAPFSQVANVASLSGLGIIIYYLFRDSVSLEGRIPVGRIQEFPLFFGTVMFALEAIGVMLPLENEMKRPARFIARFGVLNQAMAVITTLYLTIGLIGYLRFGSDVLSSITLNLPGDVEILAQVVQILLAFAMYVSHGLGSYVVIDIIWNQCLRQYFHSKKKRLIFEFIVRTAIVLTTFTLAISVPSLGLFISLDGVVCISQLGLVFPAILETSTFWYSVSTTRKIVMIVKNGIIIAIGVAGLVIGTYTTIIEG